MCAEETQWIQFLPNFFRRESGDDDLSHRTRSRDALWVCLDTSNFKKFYKILCHIESLNIYMEH
jgi:hypothetical protein